jgi:hypothetical protein
MSVKFIAIGCWRLMQGEIFLLNLLIDDFLKLLSGVKEREKSDLLNCLSSIMSILISLDIFMYE